MKIMSGLSRTHYRRAARIGNRVCVPLRCPTQSSARQMEWNRACEAPNPAPKCRAGGPRLTTVVETWFPQAKTVVTVIQNPFFRSLILRANVPHRTSSNYASSDFSPSSAAPFCQRRTISVQLIFRSFSRVQTAQKAGSGECGRCSSGIS